MRLIEKVWFKSHPAKWLLLPLLLPLSAFFYILSSLRRIFYKIGIFAVYHTPIPVIVVGNIGVGGNGKTPVVIHLVQTLMAKGYNVGVVSRGYGGIAPHYPYQVTKQSTSIEAGDEALLIFNRCHVPVMLGSNRAESAQKLVELNCDVIVTDDGLQHYALAREIELVVVDNKRLFGNGLLLPAGPLRESTWRLNSADFIVYNMPKIDDDILFNTANTPQIKMALSPSGVINIVTGEKLTVEAFKETIIDAHADKLHAIAGIGDPERFFTTLKSCDMNLKSTHGFNDHHAYIANDFEHYNENDVVIMTEKDAVKCRAWANSNWWYLTVDADFTESGAQLLYNKIEQAIKVSC